MSAPRVAPGTRRELGLLTWLMAGGAGLVARTRPLNLFRTLGKHRPLFRGWVHFAGRLMPGGVLPRRESELIILRVAHLRSCAYEFEHHQRLALRVGVTREEVERIAVGPSADGWSDRERALLTAVDGVVRDGDLDDADWAALRAHLDERAALEFLLLVGHYTMLASVVTTLRLTPDAPLRSPLRRRRAPVTPVPLRKPAPLTGSPDGGSGPERVNGAAPESAPGTKGDAGAPGSPPARPGTGD
ncbi:carboxymuconolactone decarboxylase family protein [Streptomyces sp. AJS327]|uniref:carboxymuconolactone decarboxylase family protein n=1 Tax=Streptomyces sp. AJS327 TaxID=2545265 RepID=UPI0015DE6FF4|nr:carboxymuconolactone decarboxylase family protein [Streptomyces sp. AJS327]MBA0051668.1 carboxymuconolactone decarboxylase family protein [Streptomyces sp. AJS327]